MGGKPRVNLRDLSDIDKAERLIRYTQRMFDGPDDAVDALIGIGSRLAFIVDRDPVELRSLLEANISQIESSPEGWRSCGMDIPGIAQFLRAHVRIAHGEDPDPLSVCAMLTAASMDTATKCGIDLDELQRVFDDFRKKTEDEAKERVIN